MSSSLIIASEQDFELNPESSLTIGGGYDSDENKSYNLMLDLELSNFQHLGFGYARNISSLDNSSAHRYTVFASTSAYQEFSLDVEINYLELSDALETYTFSNTINLNLENWHFSLAPQLNAISFFLNSNRQNKFDIYAKGVEISSSYFGFEKFYFSASYFKNVFSDKPSFLQPSVFDSLNIRRINKILIIEKINELASSLEEQHFSITAGKFFDWGSLDVTWSYVKLFNVAQWLDFPKLEQYNANNNISSYYVSSNLPLNKHFTVGFSLGWQTTSSESDGLLFTSTDLSYHW